MSRAACIHIWLLLTFRHPMTGLPVSFAPWSAIVFAAAAVAWLRWGLMPTFIGMLIVSLVVACFSPRLAAAYALLSIGVDLVTIPVEFVNGGRVPFLFSAWEAVGVAAIVRRLAQQSEL